MLWSVLVVLLWRGGGGGATAGGGAMADDGDTMTYGCENGFGNDLEQQWCC